MDKNTLYVLNDLLDVVDKLTELVRELNPGATNQLGFIEFMMARIERNLDDATKALERT